MRKKPLPRDPKLRNLSTKLRKNATKEENHLWYDYLRNYPIRFNRQRIIGEYIVDFFCLKAKLIIELDGSQHYREDMENYDKMRTDYLNKFGLTVMRFSNLDIKQNFEAVCYLIDTEVKKKMEVI